MPFKLMTSAFAEGATIPRLHTCDGADISPALEWGGEPDSTRSFTLIMDDPDAPRGTWNHWLLYDIPASVHSLPQGVKADAVGMSGINDFGKPGYGGPCPPPGHGPHRYFFRLYAVSVESLGLKRGAKRAEIEKALRGKKLVEAQCLGRYERK